jgi:glycerol uptake facilitator-like aquaporin
VPSAIFYWASQMLGSTFACLVLHYISAGQARGLTNRPLLQYILHSFLPFFSDMYI